MKARLLPSLALGLLCASTGQGEPGGPTVWRQATKYFFYEARQLAMSLPDPSRADRLGRAVLLFNVNPVTPAQLDLAAQELQALVQEDPADDAGLGAQYYLGRLAQVQRQPANLAAARSYYAALVERSPGSRFGELAQVKLALMDLYPSDHQAPSVAVLEAWDARSRGLADPMASRDLHVALARACLFYREEFTRQGYDARPRALAHLHAATSAGTASFRTRAELLVAIGEIASELGRFDDARAAYTAFIAEYGRDARAGTIRQHLARLPAASSP